MRTTIPLLRSAPTTSTTTTTTLLSTYLRTLKATHLQRIAQRTGIKPSGTKPVLIRQLETELPRCEYRLRCRDAVAASTAAVGAEPGPEPGTGTTGTLSILSIDMGIRNLAFAHLLVGLPPPPPPPPRPPPPIIPSSREPREERPRITLTAWRRLSLFASDFDSSPAPHDPTADPSTDAVAPTLKDTDPDAGAYSPALYAAKAYALLTTLLERYRPTHVLIERQRFRSGGSAAVQEWTIRVGVLEGMLYAVLEALRREGGSRRAGTALLPVPRAWGVEPARVSRFWAGRVSHSHEYGHEHGEGKGGGGDGSLLGGALPFSGGGGSGSSGVEAEVKVNENQTGERKNGRRRVQQQQQQQQKEHPQADSNAGAEDGTATATGRTRKKKSTREVKKMKMDLVGHWLQNASSSSSSSTTTTTSPGILAVADDQELQRWVEAYRTKWQSPKHARTGAHAHAHAHANLPDIGKLDDLADCLVQGVTWLEWQQMRHRLMANPSLLDKI